MANEPNVLLDKQIGLIRLNAAIEGMEAACMIVDQALSAVRESIGGAKSERKKLADEVEALKKAGANGADEATPGEAKETHEPEPAVA